MLKYKIEKDAQSPVNSYLQETGGYCPCQIRQDDDSTKCICEDFRSKLKDPSFYGSCICGLYTKTRI